MSRKLIRPQLPKYRALTASTRHSGPPDATNAEASYLVQAIESRSTLVVRLVGGGELRGRVEYYDRDCIKLQRDGEPNVLVRKGQIKYYWAERDAPRARS